jgi:hypothetical protein
MQTAKVGILVLALVMFFVAATAAQELAGKFAFTPQGGIGLPVGDFADSDTTNAKRGGATTGFGLGGNVEYYFSENVSAGAKFTYNRFGLDEETFADRLMGGTVDGHYSVLEFGAFTRFIFTSQSPTRVYGRAGLLFGKVKLTGDYTVMDSTFEGEADIAWSLGLEGGVGAMHMMKENMGIFGEITYTTLFTDGKDTDVTMGDETDTEEAEGNADWLGINVGVSFFFGQQAP